MYFTQHWRFFGGKMKHQKTKGWTNCLHGMSKNELKLSMKKLSLKIVLTWCQKAVATVKPCVMYNGQYRLLAKSEIMVAKCWDYYISEIKVRPAIHSVRGAVANVWNTVGSDGASCVDQGTRSRLCCLIVARSVVFINQGMMTPRFL